MLTLDRQLNKFGKFRGLVEIRFEGNINFSSPKSVLTVKNLIRDAVAIEGFTLVSLTVTANDTTSALGYNSLKFRYKIGVLSNEDTITGNTNVLYGALDKISSSFTFISLGKFPYSANTYSQADFPNYNPNTYNAVTNTVNPNQTNLLVSQNYYTVQQGDTLSKIAAKFNTTVQKLKELNEILNVNQIYVGQALKIRGDSRVIPNTNPSVNSLASAELLKA